MALENRDTPAWSPPRFSAPSTTPLVLNNSLTKTKTPFISVDPSGRKVTWYCCGPTVYDAGHLGHARNYLTTDVLRRIMRDYFGYEVIFVQNVTDVDDKIIKRAREQYFLAKYKADHLQITPEVLKDTELAYEKYARDTKGFPDDTITISQFPEWILTQKELLESSVLDEDQTIFKVRILALNSAVNALNGARTGHLPEPSQYWPAVESILSVYLGDLRKSEISPEQHSIFADYAAYWENHFNEDLRTLNCLPPTITTRVSEFIPENIDFVQQIIDNGFAYAIPGGTVYFDVNAFEKAGHFYAKLEPGNRKGEAKQDEEVPGNASQTELTAAELEIQNEKIQKRSPRDFALWKKSRVGEPGWESPWGYGRPGWHIECSAMASQVLGSHIDIHSGGIDLAFPHHDNELAQAEAYWHKDPKAPVQWVNYFIHMGHLSIAGSKMSKSLKNFVTIRDALASGDWTARKLRILFMMGGWKGGLEISQNFRAEVDLWEKTVSNFFANVEALNRESESSDGPRPKHLFRSQEKQLYADLENAQKELHAALCDSFNTGLALSTILDLISKTNTYIKYNQKSAHNPDAYLSVNCITEIARWATKMLSIFGLATSTSSDTIGWGTESAGHPESTQDKQAIILPYVQALSQFRDQVKHIAIADKAAPSCQELLKLSDNLRDNQLLQLGVALEDRDSTIGEPALIKFGDPSELIAARESKLQLQLEKEAKKEAAKAEALRLEREKAEKARLRPQDMFRTDEYSEWDEDGLPTKDAQGEEVTKSKKKTLKKAWDKQKKLYESQLGKGSAQPGSLPGPSAS